MPKVLRSTKSTFLLMLALGLVLAGCGEDEGDQPSGEPDTENQATADAAGLDPDAVAASVQEFLEADEVASGLSPAVDCGDEAAETIECSISGDKGLTGTVAAAPSQGFQYTGEIEGPEGPSSLGGSVPEGSITDPASVEAGLNDAFADDAGQPTAECPEEPEGDSLDCEVTGEGVSGTLAVTPIGGFEWEGQIETPDGTRAISGNALP